MQRGGFDVVVGNPPYVASKTIEYLSREQLSGGFPDIYAYVVLRSLRLLTGGVELG